MGLLISKYLVGNTDSDGKGLLTASFNDSSVSTGRSAFFLLGSLLRILVDLPFLHRQTDAGRPLTVFVTSNFCRKTLSVISPNYGVRCTCRSMNAGMSFAYLFAFAYWILYPDSFDTDF